MDEAEAASKQPVPEPSIIRNPIDGSSDLAASTATAEEWSYRKKLVEMVARLPKNKEQRIFVTMAKMLMAYPDFKRMTEDQQRDAMMLTRWLAHCEGHDYAEKIQNVQPTIGGKDVDPMGQPVDGAPGSAASSALSDVKPPQPRALPGGVRAPQPPPR